MNDTHTMQYPDFPCTSFFHQSSLSRKFESDWKAKDIKERLLLTPYKPICWTHTYYLHITRIFTDTVTTTWVPLLFHSSAAGIYCGERSERTTLWQTRDLRAQRLYMLLVLAMYFTKMNVHTNIGTEGVDRVVNSLHEG